MPDWTLENRPLGEGGDGIAGYTVVDALGLRLGWVSGWITDPDDRVRMLKLAVREWFKIKEFLVPIGSITLIDDRRSRIQLRELTKRSVPKYCMPFEGDIPEPRLLNGLIRFFPNPRPRVVERLEHPDEVPAPPARLNILYEQGDGSRSAPEPPFTPGPRWIRLDRLAPPDWTPLSTFLVQTTTPPS